MTALALVRYDQACRLVAEAHAVDEVKDIRDKSIAMATYARQSNNKQLENDASEIRFRAERRIGELMEEQRSTDGLASAGRPPKLGLNKTRFSNDVPAPTLKSLGIDKNLAERARKYAAIPKEEFEAQLSERRASVEREDRRVTASLLDAGDKAEKRAAREAELAGKITALPDRKYGLILDDPEWRFEVWSRETGLDRAADNHYPTSSIEQILERKVTSIAADDCAWFRWVTVPYLAQGIRSIEQDGFVYKSSWVWAKDRIGTGYWNRNRHEVLLLAVRGNVPCPAPGTQWDSLIPSPVGAHSAKPECFLEMLEAYFPNLPKIELNRRGAARPGWDAWGNEAENPDELIPAREDEVVIA